MSKLKLLLRNLMQHFMQKKRIEQKVLRERKAQVVPMDHRALQLRWNYPKASDLRV
jgi:formate-dependent nitrite reductase cytochrome c552 subunit